MKVKQIKPTTYKEGRLVMICEKSYFGRVKFQKIYLRDDKHFWRKHPSEKMIANYKKIIELDELYNNHKKELGNKA